METTSSLYKLLLLCFIVCFLSSKFVQCSVTYDKKAIIINGQRRILISGSIHYPRSTPEVCHYFFLWYIPFWLSIKSDIFLATCLKCVVFFRCGKILLGRLNTEALMLLILMFSGMYMSLLLERWHFLDLHFILKFLFFFFVLMCYFLSLCTYVQYNFEGRYDLVRFIKTVQKVGLYVHLRIGPYVCAEWNFGWV